MAIAGHVAPRMLAHYSHVRLEAKRIALDALSCFSADSISTQARAQDPLRKKGGYDTNNDTGKGTFGTARKQW
jgi:hypothetical protein